MLGFNCGCVSADSKSKKVVHGIVPVIEKLCELLEAKTPEEKLRVYRILAVLLFYVELLRKAVRQG